MTSVSEIMEKAKRWSVVRLTTVAGDGKRREMACLPLRRFFAFLSNIDASRVKPAIREKLEMYQAECDEVLWRYWSGEDEQLAQDERLRRIVREELANFTPPSKASKAVTSEEKAAIKADILAGAGTKATARKYNRAVSTVMVHTKTERATRNEQLSLWGGTT